MTQADSVHSTPPTNTSEITELPFAGLAVALAPHWGETILRLTQATDRLATRFDQFIGAETQANTVQACRELADELIAFLDGLEDADQDTASDDEPCDEDTDTELSLGSLDSMTNQAKAWTGETDRYFGDGEIEEGNDEPSLGSTGHGSGGPISYAIPVVSAAGELIHDCEGDEHDGREPDVDDERGGDEEPSLGWTIEGGTTNPACATDGEAIDYSPAGDIAAARARQQAGTSGGLTVEVSYRRFLRGLPPAQREAMKAKMTDCELVLVGGRAWGET